MRCIPTIGQWWAFGEVSTMRCLRRGASLCVFLYTLLPGRRQEESVRAKKMSKDGGGGELGFLVLPYFNIREGKGKGSGGLSYTSVVKGGRVRRASTY